MGKGTLSTVTGGYAYGNGFIVWAEDLDVFRLRSIAIDGNMNPSGNLFFTKRTIVGWMSGS
jgi:hypothetical protein